MACNIFVLVFGEGLKEHDELSKKKNLYSFLIMGLGSDGVAGALGLIGFTDSPRFPPPGGPPLGRVSMEPPGARRAYQRLFPTYACKNVVINAKRVRM